MERTGSRSLSQNSILNLGSQVAVLVIAVVCVPGIVRGLGSEAFGLLSLLWMFVGYFGFLDLGIGQASVKFLSESLARNDRVNAAQLVRASASMGIVLGLAGSAIVLVLASFGIDKIIHIPAPFREDATVSLQFLAFVLPATLLQGSLRSVPVALNRFDVVNVLQALLGVFQWGGSALVVAFGGGLLTVVVLTVCTRYLVLLLTIWVVLRMLPEVVRTPSARGKPMRMKLLSFGGWVSVSQIIPPLVAFLERAFIGAFLSLGWVTFYTVPSDALLRLLVIPTSVVSAFFPLMSGKWISDEGKRDVKLLYQRALKYVFLVMAPIVIVLIVYGADILSLWVGEEFVRKSTGIFAVLSLGTLLMSMGQLPNAALQAAGRPDLPAKLLIVELPLYALMSMGCTWAFGIEGTALAWFVRILAETAFLFAVSRKLMMSMSPGPGPSFVLKGSGLIIGCGVLLVLSKMGTTNHFIQAGVLIVVAMLYASGLWRFVLDERDKLFLLRRKPTLAK